MYSVWNKNVHAQSVGIAIHEGVAVVMHARVWMHTRMLEIPGQSGLKQSSGTHWEQWQEIWDCPRDSRTVGKLCIHVLHKKS